MIAALDSGRGTGVRDTSGIGHRLTARSGTFGRTTVLARVLTPAAPMVSDMGEITTDRLILREPRMENAEPLMSVFGDPEAMRYVNHGKTRGIDEVRASIQKRIDCLAANGFTLWTVVIADTNEVIGDCGVIPIDWTEPEFELGYRFRPSAWGKGYATEAGIAAMDHAWRVSTLDTIYAVTDLENAASQRVLTKIGFTDDGVTDKYYDDTLRFYRFDRPTPEPANDPA